jgi:hypothetical protein
LLKSATVVISKYPATVVVGFIGLLLEFIFGISWIIAVAGITMNSQNETGTTASNSNVDRNSNSNLGANYGLIAFLLFCLYWIVSSFSFSIVLSFSFSRAKSFKILFMLPFQVSLRPTTSLALPLEVK